MGRATMRAVAAASAAAVAGSVIAAMPAAADPGPAGGGLVTVRVDASAPGRVVPEDFLGLSFEAEQLDRDWIEPSASNVAALITNLGARNLRFSANAVDNTAWVADPSQTPPDWADAVVTPDDLARLGRLADATDTSIDFGVNLAHRDPATAADEVRVAREQLGERLRAVQIGNEPNVYPLTGMLGGGARPNYLTPQDYLADARAYRDAIAVAAPGTVVSGPDTAGGAVGNPVVDPALQTLLDPWLDAYIGAFGADGGGLDQHYYPFVNLERLGMTPESVGALGGMPTIDALLSRGTSAKEADFARYLAGKAHAAGLPARISETNSAAMEGVPGVTNTFGAALWTIDYATTAARAGIDGINLHGHMDDCTSYSVFCFADEDAAAAGHPRVNPNYYGAYMVGRMAGGAVLPVTVEVGATGNGSDPHVTAFAVRMPDGAVRVIVDDMDRGFDGTVRVVIDGGPGGDAQVQYLTADSLEATDGASLGGVSVGEDGTFTPGPGETVSLRDGVYPLRFSAPGAALLTVG